jgi:hypothetical protein
VAVFSPTLRNGFLPLGFDDEIILATPAIRQLSWKNLWSIVSEFNHAHYVPLTMLTFALDRHFWGLNPFGYHLTNVFLHATNTVLVTAASVAAHAVVGAKHGRYQQLAPGSPEGLRLLEEIQTGRSGRGSVFRRFPDG